MLEFGRCRQQLGPAVGHPAAVVPVVGRLQWHFVHALRVTLPQVVQQALQRIAGGHQVFWHRNHGFGRVEPHVGHPQAMRQLVATGHLEALQSTAMDHQQTGLGPL
ncbi:hypothetical protein D9M68_872640 [compost metagenome]